MHDSNFIPTWVPIQELSDWFEHWSTKGVKPFFACEYGAPFSWIGPMYRGWYTGERNWGSAKAPWEFCLPNGIRSFLGDRAFKISDGEKGQPPLGRPSNIGAPAPGIAGTNRRA